jgi:hypothetical protein
MSGAPVTDGEDNENGLLLFVEDGRLSALEYWWTSDECRRASRLRTHREGEKLGPPSPRAPLIAALQLPLIGTIG